MAKEAKFSPPSVKYLDRDTPLVIEENNTQRLLDLVWSYLVILQPGTGTATRGISVPSRLLEELGFIEGGTAHPDVGEQFIDEVSVRIDNSEGASETSLPERGRLEITKTYQSSIKEGSFIPGEADNGDPIPMRIDSTKIERFFLTRSIEGGSPKYSLEMWKRKTVTHAHTNAATLENVEPNSEFEQVEPESVNLNTLAAIVVLALGPKGWNNLDKSN